MGRGVFINWPYNWTVYLCTQATTAAPAIAYTLMNSVKGLESAPTLGRTSAGLYTITTAGTVAAFTANKTRCLINFQGGAGRSCYIAYTSTSVITLQFMDLATPTAADSGNFEVEIQVYD